MDCNGDRTDGCGDGAPREPGRVGGSPGVVGSILGNGRRAPVFVIRSLGLAMDSLLVETVGGTAVFVSDRGIMRKFICGTLRGAFPRRRCADKFSRGVRSVRVGIAVRLGVCGRSFDGVQAAGSAPCSVWSWAEAMDGAGFESAGAVVGIASVEGDIVRDGVWIRSIGWELKVRFLFREAAGVGYDPHQR